jgi:hypothetical protein
MLRLHQQDQCGERSQVLMCMYMHQCAPFNSAYSSLLNWYQCFRGIKCFLLYGTSHCQVNPKSLFPLRHWSCIEAWAGWVKVCIENLYYSPSLVLINLMILCPALLNLITLGCQYLVGQILHLVQLMAPPV